MLELSADEMARYQRHISLPQIGLQGQLRLKGARVAIIGVGGLGCPAATTLCCAGVGSLLLVDADLVSMSNLQRQPLYSPADIGKPKCEVAKQRLQSINPHVRIDIRQEFLTEHNALELLRDCDVVLDCCDNYATRFLCNDACYLAGKPLVYAAIMRFSGQLTVFDHAQGQSSLYPCYRCLIPEPPAAGTLPNCAEAGVLAVLPGILGNYQANEALKLILGIGEPLVGKMLSVELLNNTQRLLPLCKDPKCRLCSAQADIKTLQSYSNPLCEFSPTPNTMQDNNYRQISVAELAQLLQQQQPCLVDVRQPEETAQGYIPGAQLLPLGDFAAAAAQLPAEGPIYIYCKLGGRSARACDWLSTQTEQTIYNVVGGFDAWKNAGFDIKCD